MTATTSTIAAAAVVKPSGLGYGSHRRRLIAAVVLPPVGTTVALLALHHAAGLTMDAARVPEFRRAASFRRHASLWAIQ